MGLVSAENVKTNIDFCDHIETLATARWADAPPLGQYLLALAQLAQPHKAAEALDFPEFVQMLDRALDEPPPALDPAAVREAVLRAEDGGFWRFQAIALSQAAEMTRRAAIPQGQQDPLGERRPTWHNTHTLGFLEAAAVATFDGWVCDDEHDCDDHAGGGCGAGGCGSGGCGSGAKSRPSVAQVKVVYGEDGEPAVELESVSWDLFSEFLIAGQMTP